MNSVCAIIGSSTMEYSNKWEVAELRVNKCFHNCPSFFYRQKQQNSCKCIKLLTGLSESLFTCSLRLASIVMRKNFSLTLFFILLPITKISFPPV